MKKTLILSLSLLTLAGSQALAKPIIQGFAEATIKTMDQYPVATDSCVIGVATGTAVAAIIIAITEGEYYWKIKQKARQDASCTTHNGTYISNPPRKDYLAGWILWSSLYTAELYSIVSLKSYLKNLDYNAIGNAIVKATQEHPVITQIGAGAAAGTAVAATGIVGVKTIKTCVKPVKAGVAKIKSGAKSLMCPIQKHPNIAILCASAALGGAIASKSILGELID